MSLLEGYIVKSFVRRLADYGGERLLVMRSSREDSAIVVISQLVDPDPRASRTIEVVWRLTRVGDRLKVTTLSWTSSACPSVSNARSETCCASTVELWRAF